MGSSEGGKAAAIGFHDENYCAPQESIRPFGPNSIGFTKRLRRPFSDGNAALLTLMGTRRRAGRRRRRPERVWLTSEPAQRLPVGRRSHL